VVYDQEGEFLFLQDWLWTITARENTPKRPPETTYTFADPDPGVASGHYRLNPDLTIRLWNRGGSMFGWQEQKCWGVSPLYSRRPAPRGRRQAQAGDGGEVHSALELRRVRRDGSIIYGICERAAVDATANRSATWASWRISRTQAAGETLRQVSRALKAITECHQALIRPPDERELLNEVCRIIVEVGGYRMAWRAMPRLMP